MRFGPVTVFALTDTVENTFVVGLTIAEVWSKEFEDTSNAETQTFVRDIENAVGLFEIIWISDLRDDGYPI